MITISLHKTPKDMQSSPTLSRLQIRNTMSTSHTSLPMAVCISEPKRHTPDTSTHHQAIAVQQFPLSEAVHKMETQEPIYVGPILPAPFSADIFEDDIEVPVTSDNPPQENIVVNTMDKPMSNFLFNIITLINTLLPFYYDNFS